MKCGCFTRCHKITSFAVALATAACGTRAKNAIVHDSPGEIHAVSPTQLEYVPNNETTDSCTDSFGDTGRFLVEGLRLASNEEVAVDTGASGSIGGGMAIPSRLGGGFLFWDKDALYSAMTFSGRLTNEGSFRSSDAVQRVGFGPSYVLVVLACGGRIAWNRAKGFSVVQEPGLVDVATLDDGRSVMLKEHDEIWIKKAEGIKYERYQTTFVPRTVIQRFDRIEVDSNEFKRFVLTLEGELIPVNAESTRMRPWAMDASLISRPVQRQCGLGVKLQGDVAVCPTNQGFATIDLRTGNLLQLTAPIEELRWCKLVRARNDIIGLCGNQTEVLGVVSGVGTQHPQLERRFHEAEKVFFFGPNGSLLKEGSCNSTSIPGKDSRRATAAQLTLCIRASNGVWRDVEVPDKELRSRVKSLDEVHVQRWIPTAEGSAVGVIFGASEGLLYADSGKFIVADHIFDKYRQSLPRNRYWWKNDTFTLLGDGSLQGYTSEGSVRWMPNGMNEVLRSELVSLGVSGAYALGVDSANRMWQSTDYGQQWEEVSGPPAPMSAVAVNDCSSWGCDVGSWFRIGYPSEGVQFPEPAPLAPVPELPAQVRALISKTPVRYHDDCSSIQ